MSVSLPTGIDKPYRFSVYFYASHSVTFLCCIHQRSLYTTTQAQ
jgi:hypothetical protein